MKYIITIALSIFTSSMIFYAMLCTHEREYHDKISEALKARQAEALERLADNGAFVVSPGVYDGGK